MLEYLEIADGLRPDQLSGFFVGWPNPPSMEQHLELLRRSHAVEIAVEDAAVVGFATAISDGVLSAFIPFLEVLPSHQHRGIGTELVQRLLAQLDHLYMVDVCCDDNLDPFYQRFGFQTLDRGMGLRRRENI
ncbi:MAG TPA: GNAT family N-acetyltransferase [Mycobacterium sp.]|nr:GNAT family N-acetyltransferase [Mycobacterium sp.]